MNPNRLFNIAMRLLMRYGMRWFMKGQKQDPNVKRAQQSVRNLNRIRRM